MDTFYKKTAARAGRWFRAGFVASNTEFLVSVVRKIAIFNHKAGHYFRKDRGKRMKSMKRRWLGAVVVAGLLLMIVPGCKSEPKVMPDDAVVADNSYDNTFFKFRINLPEGWYALDKETVKELNDVGKKMASGDDKNLESAIEASQKNSYNLFSYFQLPPGTPNVDYIANISCVAEKVSHLPGIKTGSDYLENVKIMFGKSQIKADFAPEMKHHVFGQGEMYSIDVAINMMGHKVFQSYYSTVKNGYALAFIVSHTDPEQKAEVDKSLSSVVFY